MATPTRIRRAALPFPISPGAWTEKNLKELAYQIQEDLQFIYEQVQIKGLPKHPGIGDILVALTTQGFSLVPIDPTPQRVLTNEGIGPAGGAVPAWGQVSLSSGVKGNLPVSHLDSGVNANAGTVWLGSGHWGEPPIPFSARPVFLPPLDGEPGDDGSFGAPGQPGSQGPPGASVQGPPGSGMPGLDGEIGEEGPMGLPGQVTIQSGPQGIQGIAGGFGPPGFDGEHGDDGDMGFPGRPGADATGDGFGARTTGLSAGVIYGPADRDGLLVVELSTTGSDQADYAIFADTFSPPTTQRGGGSFNGGAIQVPHDSATVPIKRGEYYEVVVTTLLSPTVSIYFVPVFANNIGPTGSQGVAGLDGRAGPPGQDGTGDDTGGGGGVYPPGPAIVGVELYRGGPYTCQGHPQGQVAAPVGTFCVDITNGKLYQKVGGGATAYGWYFVTPFGAGAASLVGPLPFMYFPSALAADAAAALRDSAFGVWASAPGGTGGDAQDGLLSTGGQGNSVRTLIAGKVFAEWLTAATTGSNTYLANAGAGTKWCDDDWDIALQMATSTDITSMRFWFGLSTALISDTDTVGSANGAIMFRSSTPAADGGWVGYTSDAGGGTAVTATVLAIAASTVYRLRIRFQRSGTPTVFFSINDGTEVSQTSRIIPTGKNSFIQFGITTKANTAKHFLWRACGGNVGS